MKVVQSIYNYVRKVTRTHHPDDPRTPDKREIGEFRIMDIPEIIDEVMRLWIIDYNNRMKRFFFLRPLVEWFVISRRFMSYTEYLTLFQDGITKGLKHTRVLPFASTGITDMRTRYPAYRILRITNEEQRKKFTESFQESQKGYYYLMKLKHKNLYKIFTQRHKASISTKDRIHTYITGTTGFGKSEQLKTLIYGDIQANNGTVIVIDPLGGFVTQIAKFAEHTKNHTRVIFIDPNLDNRKTVPVINPFELEDRSDEIEVDLTAQAITGALLEIFVDLGQEITPQMTTILVPSISTILRNGGDLKDLQRFMAEEINAKDRDKISKGDLTLEDITTIPYTQMALKTPNPFHREFFRVNLHHVGSYRASKDGLATKIQYLLNLPSLANVVTGASTINLKQAIREKKIILFNLSVGKSGDQTPYFLGKFILSLIQSAAFQREWKPEEKKQPIYFYIDEFQDFVNPSLLRILSQGRQFGMYLTVANQYLEQLKSSDVKGVINNTNLQFVGQNGASNLKAMGTEFYLDDEEFKKLLQGNFMLKITKEKELSVPFVLSNKINLLGDENSMAPMQWERMKAYQIKTYYRKPTYDHITTDNTQPNTDSNSSTPKYTD
jgi:Helicase HerA, central domain